MASKRVILRLFIAGPSDVAKERAAIRKTAEELNQTLGEPLGVQFEIKDWQQVAPGDGRPQELIFREIPPESWDLFIGVLWGRFGTPPGARNPSSGVPYHSGTQEEFEAARRLLPSLGPTRIQVYQCTRSLNAHQLDPAQFQRVKEFINEFRQDGSHPGLVKEFKSLEQLKQAIRKHLTDILFKSAPWWTDQNSLLNQLMGTVARIYRKQHKEVPFLHHKVVFSVTAGIWLASAAPCIIDWSLEFSAFKEPIYCMELSLIMTPAEGLMTTPDVKVTDSNGNLVDIEQVPIRDPSAPDRRSMLIYFLPPVRSGSGRYRVSLAEKGPLHERDLRDLTYGSERLQGAFGRIELLLHVPEAIEVEFKRSPKSPAGSLMRGKELSSHAAPDGFKTIGWVGKGVRLGKDEKFGVVIFKKTPRSKAKTGA